MNNLNLSIYHDAGFNTSQMRLLEGFLEQNPSIHWLKLNPSTGIYEMILDNQMMSDFRACAAYFIEAHVKGLGLKGIDARNWNLEIGTLFHHMIESYYSKFREAGFSLENWAIDEAMKKWAELDMDFHREHKEYKAIGGFMGFCGLITAYALKYGPDNERLRIIGTEISFGHGKEVFLGELDSGSSIYKITPWLICYLSGRIDLLCDTGDSICPLDHKTMGSFRFDPISKFEIDEGPTGYIYAVNQILPSLIKELGLPDGLLRRDCNKIIMNFISKSIPKEGERFKRHPILKTTEQLESYRLRMLSTQEAIFRSLVRYIESNAASRDTSKCTNWYMHDCTFLPIHRQNSKENELKIINAFYEKREIWNTEEI
jgi:hypothetical protein